jgi:hypothetical protein
MHDNDEMNDDALYAVRDSLAGMPTPVPPPLEAIVARGRARRRRSRRLVAAGIAAAVVLAVAIGLSALAGKANAPKGPLATVLKLGTGPVHVELTAYSVNSNPNGTVTVTLTLGQTIDPSTLREILAQAGVPALFSIGFVYETPSQPPAPASGHRVISPSIEDGKIVLVITPSALPPGTELSIGYFPNHVAFRLVTIGAPMVPVSD